MDDRHQSPERAVDPAGSGRERRATVIGEPKPRLCAPSGLVECPARILRGTLVWAGVVRDQHLAQRLAQRDGVRNVGTRGTDAGRRQLLPLSHVASARGSSMRSLTCPISRVFTNWRTRSSSPGAWRRLLMTINLTWVVTDRL